MKREGRRWRKSNYLQHLGLCCCLLLLPFVKHVHDASDFDFVASMIQRPL